MTGKITLGRSNWLFAGSLRAGKRAVAIMSLVHSAKLNGHEPHAYLKDVLERLPTPAREPHRRAPAVSLAARDLDELSAAPIDGGAVKIEWLDACDRTLRKDEGSPELHRLTFHTSVPKMAYSDASDHVTRYSGNIESLTFFDVIGFRCCHGLSDSSSGDDTRLALSQHHIATMKKLLGERRPTSLSNNKG